MESILLHSGLRALLLENYGSGNAPSTPWFIDTLKAASEKGLILVNVTQCPIGSVDMEKYTNGLILKEVGVISGYDMTTEAAICKLFLFLGQQKDNETVKTLWQKNIRGEVTIN
jgi:L-asparaginase